MVIQKKVRTYYVISIIWSAYLFRLREATIFIKSPIFIQTCDACAEWPSYISTMVYNNNKKKVWNKGREIVEVEASSRYLDNRKITKICYQAKERIKMYCFMDNMSILTSQNDLPCLKLAMKFCKIQLFRYFVLECIGVCS